MKYRQVLILHFCLLALLGPLFAQQEEANIYQMAEAYYGNSDLLVNGPAYIPSNPRAKGTPLFRSKELFSQTRLYIKGEVFYGEKLQYDIEMDRFVLDKSSDYGETGTLMLSNDFIDSVQLGPHFFVKANLLADQAQDLGFVELIYIGRETFIAKHTRHLDKAYTKDNPNGQYSESKIDKYLIKNGELIPMNSSKTFLNHFKDKKSEVKRYLRAKEVKYRKADSQQLKDLLRYCYEE